MQKTLLLRIIAIIGLTLALVIPLEMIRAVVSERQGLQAQVERTIAASSSGAQQLAGPLLVVPYTEQELVISTDSKGKETKKWIDYERQIMVVPTHSRYDGIANIEPKYKGIYKALTYRTSSKWQADFEVPQNLGRLTREASDHGGRKRHGASRRCRRSRARSPRPCFARPRRRRRSGTGRRRTHA